MVIRDLEGRKVRRKDGERARVYLRTKDEGRLDMMTRGREEERERN